MVLDRLFVILHFLVMIVTMFGLPLIAIALLLPLQASSSEAERYGASVVAHNTSYMLRFKGVNLAGAEFNSRKIPGEINKDYVYPSEADVDAFLSLGMNTFRLPFRWERLQRSLYEEFDANEAEQIDTIVAYVTERGGYVVLDPHNYGRYLGKKIGSEDVPVSAFVDLWRRLALRYGRNDRVIFGLMNEPFDIPAQQWRLSVDAVISAIREAGLRNLILVPGTAWTGAHSWMRARDGLSNADAFAELQDPGGNMAFEVHQYLDKDSSGTTTQCVSASVGADRLAGMTHWLRRTGNVAFLGEFGASSDPICLVALERMLQHLKENADVWIGWTYWAAGRWWGSYPFSIQPSPNAERPQTDVLSRHLARSPAR